ncbi:hypothetical protein [Marinospirillum perlucidum]|uniref:hypothetical protein n=1 Tax=Marinospirillum perlucidum TaxID=1982602 RepID=UPI000DF2C03D|nr:hypothetical protein [Marinospirillum perlucidum]
MLGKILITGLVLAVTYFYWKKQLRQQESNHQQRAPQQPLAGQLEHPDRVRFAKVFVFLVVAVALLASGGYAYYDWQDKHTLLEVRVVNPVSGQDDVYEVYKKDLQEKAFTTRHGQHIRIANSERLEVRPLNEEESPF